MLRKRGENNPSTRKATITSRMIGLAAANHEAIFEGGSQPTKFSKNLDVNDKNNESESSSDRNNNMAFW